MSSVHAAQKDYPLQQNPLSDVQLAQSPTRQPPPDHILTDDGIDGRTSDPDRMFDSALSGDDNSNPPALIPSHQLHHSIIINGDENSPPHINDSSSSSSSSSSSLDQSPQNHIPSNSMVAISANMQPTPQSQGLSDDQPYSEEEPNNETTESHELKRVKVYELIGARWVDQGTAFCFGDFQDSEALLVARAEADFNHIILTTTIRSTDVYQRQQETLIVWTEPDGVDYALSFQDPEGCAEVWNFIQEVQRHMNATEAGLSSSPVLGDSAITTASIIRSGHLPTPALGIMGEIEKAIKAITRTPQLKERVCEYIQSEDYIKSMIDVMAQAEDLESIDNLHALCSCMQTILMLNDHSLYEHILDDDLFFGVVGMLEYDPEFPAYKANYREFLRTTTQYHQPIQIRDPSIQKKIHSIYRLQFLKDVVLARAIDDSTFNVLNSSIIFNQIDIINHVQNDVVFLGEVVGLFVDQEGREVKEEDVVPLNVASGSGEGSGEREETKVVKSEVDQTKKAEDGSSQMDVDETSLSTKSNGPSTSGTQPHANGVASTSTSSASFNFASTSTSTTAIPPTTPMSTSLMTRRQEVVFLIQQLCVMGKNVQLPARMQLFRILTDCGIPFIVQWALEQEEYENTIPVGAGSGGTAESSSAKEKGKGRGKEMIAAGGEILMTLLDHDLNGVRAHIVKQLEREAASSLSTPLTPGIGIGVGIGIGPGIKPPTSFLLSLNPHHHHPHPHHLVNHNGHGFENGEEREKGREGGRESLAMLMCRLLVRSRDLAVQSQIAEALKMLLEVMPADAEPHPMVGAKMLQRRDDPASEKFLDYFYKQCIFVLFKPLLDLPEFNSLHEPIVILSRERTNLFLNLCEILSTFIVQHSFRSHFFVLSSIISTRVASLLSAKDKHLRLAAFRFFRVLLRLNNRNIFNHLIKYDLLRPVLELTMKESRRDNLLSSTCQEFFEHMRKENLKELIHHCMTKHEETIKALAETMLGGPRFKAFIRRWEMNVEPLPKEDEKVEKISTPNSFRKWGQGRLLEIEEEDYFNADDEEDETLPVLSSPSIPRTISNAASNSPSPSTPPAVGTPPLRRKRTRPSTQSGIPMRPSRPPLLSAQQQLQLQQQQQQRTSQPLGSLVDYDDGDDLSGLGSSEEGGLARSSSMQGGPPGGLAQNIAVMFPGTALASPVQDSSSGGGPRLGGTSASLSKSLSPISTPTVPSMGGVPSSSSRTVVEATGDGAPGTGVENPEDETDDMLDRIVFGVAGGSPSGPPSPSIVQSQNQGGRNSSPFEMGLGMGMKRRREDEDDDGMMERLVSKSKKPSVGAVFYKENVKKGGSGGVTGTGAGAGTGTVPQSEGGFKVGFGVKGREEGAEKAGTTVSGPKKIKLKLAGALGLAGATSAPSCTGTKDGDGG